MMRMLSVALALLVTAAKQLSVHSLVSSISSIKKRAVLLQRCRGKEATHFGRALVLQSSSPSSLLSDDADKVDLTQDEWVILRQISQQANNTGSTLEDVLLQALPNLHPRLILKLRQQPILDNKFVGTGKTEDQALLATLSQTLQTILNTRLVSAKQVLESMLQAGEIRKLDAAIGKAARQGQLDAAFFTVLQKNLEDAAAMQNQPNMPSSKEIDSSDVQAPATAASRYQILQHIRTRCQEEVEKDIPPGLALLNKLLRTEQSSIRTNQLKHYLCPQPPPSIPGVEAKVDPTKPGFILIPPSSLVEALAQTVQQIRTIENAGATSRESAAAMIESCRQVAKEARVVLAQEYGLESNEMRSFEDDLMPVFRPTTSDSSFIQGY